MLEDLEVFHVLCLLGVRVTPAVTSVEKIASTRIRTQCLYFRTAGECSTAELWGLIVFVGVAGLCMNASVYVMCYRECVCFYTSEMSKTSNQRPVNLSATDIFVITF